MLETKFLYWESINKLIITTRDSWNRQKSAPLYIRLEAVFVPLWRAKICTQEIGKYPYFSKCTSICSCTSIKVASTVLCCRYKMESGRLRIKMKTSLQAQHHVFAKKDLVTLETYLNAHRPPHYRTLSTIYCSISSGMTLAVDLRG